MAKPRTGRWVAGLAAVAVLLALLAGASLTAAGHRCLFDEMQRLQLATGTSAAAETGRRGAPQREGAEPHGDPTAPDSWQPIRIAVFTEDLDDSSRYCTQPGETRPDFEGRTLECDTDSILTSEKKRMLREMVIPDAVRMHEDRLLVQRLSSDIHVEHLTGYSCSQFTVPQSHHTTGVPDADFVLYVAAGPIDPNYIGWATMCQYDSSGRPIVGVANISPRYIKNDSYLTYTMAHEILHALGFSKFIFDMKYMLTVVSVRGKPESFVMNSPKVVQAARAHYGCSTMRYVELEDMGGSGTVGSHWKMRSAKDELMSPKDSASMYTAITIAAMEDTGFYRGNYSNAESMAWGKNAGCVLFDRKCVTNGVSQVPGMFCIAGTHSMNDLKCTTDRLGIGNCITKHNNRLPAFAQYFPDPSMGGTDPCMDYCPYVEEFANTNCLNGDASMMPGSVLSSSARCFSAMPSTTLQIGDGKSMLAICADVLCDEGTSSYRVRVKGASAFVDCPPGRSLVPSKYSADFSTGAIECAPYEEVCRKTSPRSGADDSGESDDLSGADSSGETRHVTASGSTGGRHT